ncbi:MAG: hypothetical protein A2W31_05095 [Planctomycetes bacterium RBG_16_64_10]|nr:MAG: hypothetical protein A2W31_05095 [Planctomycetes bacterium RBG_16_64_10]
MARQTVRRKRKAETRGNEAKDGILGTSGTLKSQACSGCHKSQSPNDAPMRQTSGDAAPAAEATVVVETQTMAAWPKVRAAQENNVAVLALNDAGLRFLMEALRLVAANRDPRAPRGTMHAESHKGTERGAALRIEVSQS